MESSDAKRIRIRNSAFERRFHIENRIRKLALLCARAAEERKGENIVVLDVRKVFFLADYFILCSGNNAKHLQAMADEIRVKMRGERASAIGMEGYGQGAWILIDFGDVVIHLLQGRLRDYYELDQLWADARQVKWQKIGTA